MARRIHIHVAGKTKDSQLTNAEANRIFADFKAGKLTYEQAEKKLLDGGWGLAKRGDKVVMVYLSTKDAGQMDVQQAQAAINIVKRQASALRSRVEDDLHVVEELEEDLLELKRMCDQAIARVKKLG